MDQQYSKALQENKTEKAAWHRLGRFLGSGDTGTLPWTIQKIPAFPDCEPEMIDICEALAVASGRKGTG